MYYRNNVIFTVKITLLDVISSSLFAYGVYAYYITNSFMWFMLIMLISAITHSLRNDLIYSIAREDVLLVGNIPEDDKEEDNKN